MAVEQPVVLLGEIEERRADGQRDHDRVDAGGAHRDRADERGDDPAVRIATGHIDLPRPVEAKNPGPVRAQDGDPVAGDAGDGELGHRDHAAIAAEDRQRQSDHAEDQRLRAKLEHDEGGGDERKQDERDGERRGGRRELGRHDIARRRGRGWSASRVRGLPMIPCGRSARVTTMMTKVSTTP